MVGDLARLRLGIGELGDGGVGRGLVLVVGLLRGPAVADELAAALIVGLGLDHLRPGRLDGGPRRVERESEVGPVEAHQGLAEADVVPRIDEALVDLAADPEAEVALGAGPDDAGVARDRRPFAGRDRDGLDQRRLRRHCGLGRASMLPGPSR